MTISIRRGYQIMQEGKQRVKISGLQELKDCEVAVDGKTVLTDIILTEFTNSQGKSAARCFPVMEEGTRLGRIVQAVNGGEIPDEIDDLEEFLVGRELTVMVTHNRSAKTGRLFANAEAVLPGEYEEERQFEDEDKDSPDQDEESDGGGDEDDDWGEDEGEGEDGDENEEESLWDEGDWEDGGEPDDLMADEDLEEDLPPVRKRKRAIAS